MRRVLGGLVALVAVSACSDGPVRVLTSAGSSRKAFEPPAGWQYQADTTRSEMKDAPTVRRSLELWGEVPARPGDTAASAVLQIGCKHGVPEIWLAAPDALEEKGAFRVRFDRRPAFDPLGGQLADGQIYFLLPWPFQDSLRQADSLRVEYTPARTLPRVARFRVSGFAKAFAPLDSVCGKPKAAVKRRRPA